MQLVANKAVDGGHGGGRCLPRQHVARAGHDFHHTSRECVGIAAAHGLAGALASQHKDKGIEAMSYMRDCWATGGNGAKETEEAQLGSSTTAFAARLRGFFRSVGATSPMDFLLLMATTITKECKQPSTVD